MLCDTSKDEGTVQKQTLIFLQGSMWVLDVRFMFIQQTHVNMSYGSKMIKFGTKRKKIFKTAEIHKLKLCLNLSFSLRGKQVCTHSCISVHIIPEHTGPQTCTYIQAGLHMDWKAFKQCVHIYITYAYMLINTQTYIHAYTKRCEY